MISYRSIGGGIYCKVVQRISSIAGFQRSVFSMVDRPLVTKAVFGFNQCRVLVDVCASYGMHRATCTWLTSANIHGRPLCPSRTKYPGH